MEPTPSIRRRSDAPELRPGITLLRGDRGTTGLHRLVAQTLATATGPAYWVDAGNEAAPHALFRATRDRLSLERLRIARAFTAYQHHALVERLVGHVDAETSLVVASSLPALYTDDDLLPGEGAALFRESVKRLLRLRRRFDVPVLVTHTPDDRDARDVRDGFAGLLAACADREVEVVETDLGVRFVGGDARTTAYDGTGYRLAQATLDAFVEVARERALDPPTDGVRPDAPGVEA